MVTSVFHVNLASFNGKINFYIMDVHLVCPLCFLWI
jgi:hypothetical protein